MPRRSSKKPQASNRVCSVEADGQHRSRASARLFTPGGMKAHLHHGKYPHMLDGREVVTYELVEVARVPAAKFCGVPHMLRLKGMPNDKGEG